MLNIKYASVGNKLPEKFQWRERESLLWCDQIGWWGWIDTFLHWTDTEKWIQSFTQQTCQWYCADCQWQNMSNMVDKLRLFTQVVYHWRKMAVMVCLTGWLSDSHNAIAAGSGLLSLLTSIEPEKNCEWDVSLPLLWNTCLRKQKSNLFRSNNWRITEGRYFAIGERHHKEDVLVFNGLSEKVPLALLNFFLPSNNTASEVRAKAEAAGGIES